MTYLLTGRLISDPIGPRTDDGSGGGSQPNDYWADPSNDQACGPQASWDQPYYF